uniref:DUF6884 domain-containing protein n=1 Tax=Thermomicrobium roseum TaxID=500 RepID=A0A7C1FSA0_THERO
MELLLLSCSASKRDDTGELPALLRYDGPLYQDLRRFVRENGWPPKLHIGIFSARYGLIGALAPIPAYDQRLTPERAAELLPSTQETLTRWRTFARHVTVVAGRDYAQILTSALAHAGFEAVSLLPGGIGEKRAQMRAALAVLGGGVTARRDPADCAPRTYFLPDWEDFVDPHYDFERDQYSAPATERNRVHASALAGERICDGILVSLAQRLTHKGLLRRVNRAHPGTTAPEDLRRVYALSEDQLLFGDCGAFSYIQEPEPPLSVAEAAFLYHIYDFDLGASVDHIPAPDLPMEERRRRTELTLVLAESFLREARRYGSFIPVGVAHGIDADDYVRSVLALIEMGYRHIGVGGLVFRTDHEVAQIVQAISRVRSQHRKSVWLHLFGIFRPKLQRLFAELDIQSFDSASYFRKAWLRSDQNYLGVNGNWYAAIRVPASRDGRNQRKLERAGVPRERIQELEQAALTALARYGRREIGLEETLDTVLEYDSLIDREDIAKRDIRALYQRTLLERPWEQCGCRICRELGIDVVIFRGAERNRRRGVHNTLQLYRRVHGGGLVGGAPDG